MQNSMPGSNAFEIWRVFSRGWIRGLREHVSHSQRYYLSQLAMKLFLSTSEFFPNRTEKQEKIQNRISAVKQIWKNIVKKGESE